MDHRTRAGLVKLHGSVLVIKKRPYSNAMEKENKNTLQRPPRMARFVKMKPKEKGPIGSHAAKVTGCCTVKRNVRCIRRVGKRG